jgi:large subunit ribosomal protein L17
MRHHSNNRKFGRKMDGRKALMRSLALNLVIHGKIRTTEAKAKETRPFVEKMITTAKAGDVNARRLIISKLNSVSGAEKLCKEIAPKYIDRQGGYTRIIKLPARDKDGSKMAVIELV